MVTELIPILIDLSVGAALWAADIEHQTNAMVKETAPNLRQAAEGAE